MWTIFSVHVQLCKSNFLSAFHLQCILTSKSPHNIPTRHVSPRLWWSQTPTASALSAPCPQARQWVFHPHLILVASVKCMFSPRSTCYCGVLISIGLFAQKSAVNYTYIKKASCCNLTCALSSNLNWEASWPAHYFPLIQKKKTLIDRNNTIKAHTNSGN